MDAYDRFLAVDAAADAIERANERDEASGLREGVDTLAEVARERYELRSASTEDVTTGEAA